MSAIPELNAALDRARSRGFDELMVYQTFWAKTFGRTLPGRWGPGSKDIPLLRRCLEERDPEPYYRQLRERFARYAEEGRVA